MYIPKRAKDEDDNIIIIIIIFVSEGFRGVRDGGGCGRPKTRCRGIFVKMFRRHDRRNGNSRLDSVKYYVLAALYVAARV